MDRIQRVGCFAWDMELVTDPISVLKEELDRHAEVKNSLIVLPEAFDICTGYHGVKEWDRTNAVALRLAAIAVERQIAFVAGLVFDDDPSSPRHLPWNRAFLIHGKCIEVLAGKRFCDKPGRFESWGDDSRLRQFAGRKLGALVCIDASDWPELRRERQILASRDRTIRELEHGLLCVPAWTSYQIHGRHLGSTDYVVANGGKGPSALRIGGTPEVEVKPNKLVLCDYPAHSQHQTSR